MKRWMRPWFVVLMLVPLACGAGGGSATSATPTQAVATASPTAPRLPQALRVEVVATYPHDPEAFTQGLLWHDGVLYESTGLNGRSSVREVDLTSGAVRRQHDLAQEFFGEGLALVGEQLVQLTWQHGVAFVYDRAGFRELRRLSYTGEGWGLSFDGTHLVMSDGSSNLFRRDPTTFAVQSTLPVRLRGSAVPRLNELEVVGATIYANVWLTDRILAIDAATGEVTAEIDASGLLTAAERARADVLNGIAHDPTTGDFLITGKLWPKLFRVRFVPR